MTVFHLLFALLSIVMIAYLLRHYNFVSTVLLHERKTKKTHKNIEHQQPTVSIIIPAHNEEKVIETLLQRITELYYPKEKFGGILLLNIYTVPILVGIGWLLAAICLLLITQLWTGQTTLIITLIYLAAGNIVRSQEYSSAPPSKKRLSLCKYVPMLLVAFTLNVFICTKAAIDIAIDKIRRKTLTKWNKTTHNGTTH